MNVSDKGIDLIKSFEGFWPTMYLDSANLPTIGYGTLIDEQEETWLLTATINEVTAVTLLKRETDLIEQRIRALIKKPLTQNQYDAIVSFTYNVGSTALRKSTLLLLLNKNPNDPLIRNQFMRWVRAGGKVNKGLVNRRQKEADLYFS